MSDQSLEERSDMAIIREYLPFFECIQRGEYVGLTITRHQSKRIYRRGLTFRGKGIHNPLMLTRYSARLLAQVQQEADD
uniref:Uncharacterized protein n=1 Tax=viral metagenome TaxID=1070528 RepID=A0A6M3M6G9_9ZZZZ